MSSKHWDAENIPDQTDRVVIVTGSSSGIGFEAARVLAEKNAEVILAVRNEKKGDAARAKILAQVPVANVKVMLLDLANLSAVTEFSKAFGKAYQKLDLLINNAGVMIPPYSKTADGFELQFGTNHMGHFALTAQLLDLLKKTQNSRIVTVSSNAHLYGKLNFDDLNWENRKYQPWRAYGDSKIANLYFTYELQRRLTARSIDVLAAAAHPGWTATDLQRNSLLARIGNRLLAMSLDRGALPTLRAAIDPQANGGDYYGPNGFREMRGWPVKVKSNALSCDEGIAEKLWQVSEERTGSKFGF